MAIDPLSAGLLGGGSLLGAAGGLFGASSANRQARKNRDFYVKQTESGFNKLGDLFYGKPFRAFHRASWTGSPEEVAAAQAEMDQVTGGPILQQMRNLATTGGQRLDRLDALSQGMAQGVQGQARRMSSLASGMEGLASEYGRGRETQIERDAQRASNSADQQLAAQLRASGFGNSTTALQTRAGSRRGFSEMESDAKQNLSDRQVGLRMDARRSALGTEGGIAQMLMQAQNANIANQQQNLAARLGLQQNPLNAMLSVQQSGVMNPMLGYNPSQGGGQSGLGSALGSLGQGAAGLGSLLLFNQMGGGNSWMPPANMYTGI
jgi:hypothetical protein